MNPTANARGINSDRGIPVMKKAGVKTIRKQKSVKSLGIKISVVASNEDRATLTPRLKWV